jgi:hypothetical protein
LPNLIVEVSIGTEAGWLTIGGSGAALVLVVSGGGGGAVVDGGGGGAVVDGGGGGAEVVAGGGADELEVKQASLNGASCAARAGDAPWRQVRQLTTRAGPAATTVGQIHARSGVGVRVHERAGVAQEHSVLQKGS